jgi:hypothetical protein
MQLDTVLFAPSHAAASCSELSTVPEDFGGLVWSRQADRKQRLE